MRLRFLLCIAGCTLLAACANTPASVVVPSSGSGATDVSALALQYLLGRDVERDPAMAVKLYTQAALTGDAAAAAALGQLYERGVGVHKDLVTAYAWYQLSADQNNEDGSTGMLRIRPMLTQDQWNAASMLHDQLDEAIVQ